MGLGQVSAIPSEVIEFGSSTGNPSSSETDGPTDGRRSPHSAASSSAVEGPVAGGLETWVSMTQEHAQDYSAAIASLLGVSVTSEVVGGAVPPHVERAWTRACDLALAHGSVREVGETLGTVCIRFAHLGDTWSSVDTLQRTGPI